MIQHGVLQIVLTFQKSRGNQAEEEQQQPNAYNPTDREHRADPPYLGDKSCQQRADGTNPPADETAGTVDSAKQLTRHKPLADRGDQDHSNRCAQPGEERRGSHRKRIRRQGRNSHQQNRANKIESQGIACAQGFLKPFANDRSQQPANCHCRKEDAVLEFTQPHRTRSHRVEHD